MKEGQKVCVQVAGDGPLREIVAEADWRGRVRGYVKRPHIHVPLRKGKLDVGGAVGDGFINVVKDLGLKEPYRGTVALQTGEIAADLAYYMNASEQIPSVVALGVFVNEDGSVGAAGGFIIQTMPEVSDDTIDLLEDRMKILRPVSSMVLDGMEPEDIIKEAVGLPVKVIERKDVEYYCPCDKTRAMEAIITLGIKELEGYVERGEPVEVTCRFCRVRHVITAPELASVLDELREAEQGQGRRSAAG
jgi:molecular chaperone Hsp33